MIRIVNWLLTRKCNLSCGYCAIVKNYEDMPFEYPQMSHYLKNEMSTSVVLYGLELLKRHNPDCFHIFYGGEPLLRNDLSKIISFCNNNDIHYTIISNNTNSIRPLINKLFEEVGTIKGFTASVDPSFNEEKIDDRVIKSISGLENLIALKNKVNDVVAEITVMKHNYMYLYSLVKQLTANGISSDITFVDIAKNKYYDFSNIKDESLLLGPSNELAEVFQTLSDSDLDIHMKNILLPMIYNILPSNMDCEIEKNLHNITVDADGSIRLCLRIRGTRTPSSINFNNLFDEDCKINNEVYKRIREDKQEFCQRCNHTCLLMSKYIDKTDRGSEDLIHLDRRI